MPSFDRVALYPIRRPCGHCFFSAEQVTPQVVPPAAQVKAQVSSNEAQVKAQVAKHILVLLAHEPLSSSEIVKGLGHKSLSGVVKTHLGKLLSGGLIEMSQPDSPRSPTQKYRLTAKGLALIMKGAHND